jgi:23S rRNA (uracil1939-C5)-methyltransferase
VAPDLLPPLLAEDAPVGVRLIEVEEVELTIEKLIAGGDGLARLDGVPIFVPRTAPGDRVRARLIVRRPDFGRAEVIEVLTPGEGRREAPCPHFAECGGCDLQHLDERHQLRYKVEAAVETLRRLAKIPLPPPSEVLAGAAWGYRIRAQIHTAPAGAGFQAGYHARGSKRLVPIEVCPVLDPRLEEEAVRLGRRLGPEAPGRIDLAIGGDGRVTAAPAVAGLEEGELQRRVAGFDYAYDARCFFQGHQGLLDALVERVVGEARGELAFDLYGGVGLFALPLATRYARVVTVEADRIASRYARKNARTAKLDGVEAVSRSVDTWIGEALPPDADRVLVDPPRQGLSAAVRAVLAERPPRRLTYVSCHAAALARDLVALGPALEVESLVFVDLFPQTGHLETVVQLVRRAPNGD